MTVKEMISTLRKPESYRVIVHDKEGYEMFEAKPTSKVFQPYENCEVTEWGIGGNYDNPRFGFGEAGLHICIDDMTGEEEK